MSMSLFVRRKTIVKLLMVLISAVLLLFLIKFYTRPSTTTIEMIHATVHEFNFTQTERLRADGVLHYERKKVTEVEPNLLWLALTNNLESWGKQRVLLWTTNRTFTDYIDLISSQVDVDRTSIGLLTSSRKEYELYKSVVQNCAFPLVNIFMHPGFNKTLTVDRARRHDHAVQTSRRAELAKLRNYLMLKTLGTEEHIIWLDADVYYLQPEIVARMVRHSKDQHDIGLLTARCGGKGIDDYDRNAWRGTRKGPRGWDLDQDEIKAGEMKRQGQLHIAELYKGTRDDELIELTTVGATILYIRAELIWQGLSFPHQFVVGTRWGKHGWDGIESEGLCYRSQGLDGGKCAFLGGKWHVEHTAE